MPVPEVEEVVFDISTIAEDFVGMLAIYMRRTFLK
jgi:hypothetical protein